MVTTAQTVNIFTLVNFVTCILRKIQERGLELWDHKEVTTTLTAPGTKRTTAGSDIGSKILGKSSVKKLVNKGDCIKD